MEKLITILILLISLQSSASESSKAIEKASIAFYKQTGLENQVNRFKKKYVPEIILNNGWVLAVGAAVKKQEYKVEYEWKF